MNSVKKVLIVIHETTMQLDKIQNEKRRKKMLAN